MNLLAIILALFIMLFSGLTYQMISRHNKFNGDTSYALAEIDPSWWDCYNCENNNFYADYIFKTVDGKTIFIENESIGVGIRKQLEKGEIPALVEYYPKINPVDFRFVGDNDILYIILMVAFITFTWFIVGIFANINTIIKAPQKKKKRKKRNKK